MQKDLQMQETLTPLKNGEYPRGTPKDKDSVTEGEYQDSEESEEEGEIGDSQTLVRRSTRGRKSSREKREQETYKEKLQGTQLTLEKMLEKNPKAHINQSQGSKGALSSQKRKQWRSSPGIVEGWVAS